jgi:hypothetical protein
LDGNALGGGTYLSLWPFFEREFVILLDFMAELSPAAPAPRPRPMQKVTLDQKMGYQWSCDGVELANNRLMAVKKLAISN